MKPKPSHLSWAAYLARLVLCCGVVCVAAPASAGPTIEQRIEDIQRLIPPVFVQGERKPRLSSQP